MLEPVSALTPSKLEAVAALERRTVAADGGRLKLEAAALARESWDRVLWWDGARLLGFLGAYRFGADAELAGMVDPAARRQGIGTALLTHLTGVLAGRGVGSALLVAPRATDLGRAFALARGAVLDHSEHALALDGPLAAHEADEATVIREAHEGDVAEVVRLVRSGFGYGDATMLQAAPGLEHLVVERNGVVIGYLRASVDDGEGGVHGFVIDESLRGRGIGRDVLARVCARLRSHGAGRIGLEVEVDNDHALGLYTSLGFAPVTTEDYFRLGTG